MAILQVRELHALGMTFLKTAGVPARAAKSVVDALIAAELEGLASHGFSRLPFYVAQVHAGKIRAEAEPSVHAHAPAALIADAANGFAYPAIDMGLKDALEAAGRFGVCGLGVTRSHHSGAMGYHVEKCAAQGYTALAFANAPASMAPWGGNRACFGTNPIAFACPRADAPPLVIDLSLSKAARGKVVMAQKKGEPIPEGWALDADGNPTTDPARAMEGMMLPMGDAKGAALALMVEIFSAGLSGSNFSTESTSFFGTEGGPPGTGQFFLLLKTNAFAPAFAERIEVLLGGITGQEGARLPGAKRIAEREKRRREGVPLDDDLLKTLKTRS